MSKKFKILIFSDSLALPRAVDNAWTHYEETWPFLLKSRLPNVDIAHCGIGSSITSDLIYQFRYWKAHCPDLVIVQAGLVDCVPRALKKSELAILKSFVPGRVLSMIIKKHTVRLRKIRKISYTDIQEFERNVIKFKNEFENILWLSICSDDARGNKLPGYLSQINRYNKVILENLNDNYIDLSMLNLNDFVDDGFHLSNAGHDKIAKLLIDRITKVM